MNQRTRRKPGEHGALPELPDLPPFPDEDETDLVPEYEPRYQPSRAEAGGLPPTIPDELEPEEDEGPDLRPGSIERPLRVGVIGVGFGAAVHIPALMELPETEVITVCARRTERAIGAAAKFNIPLVTTDFRELLAEPSVEAVVIAAPPFLHHAMSIAAFEAGKHVLLEKPMARSLAEARDMAKMADSAGVVAMVNHEYRFHPVRARIKELLDQGYIGTPQAISLTAYTSTLSDPYTHPFGWMAQAEKGGGMLAAVGSHHVDALRWWYGDITGVAGATATMVPRRLMPDGSGMAKVDADDNFAFLVRFASGALGTVQVSATSGVDSGEEIILSGSEGMLIAQGDQGLFGARRGEAGMTEIDVPNTLPEGAYDEEQPLIAPTKLLIRRWVEAIREGTPSPSPSFADGVKVQEILEGALRSGQQGRWIDTSGVRWPTAVPRHVGY